MNRESLQSHYYSCQQKKYYFTSRFEEAQSIEERYYWIKLINKNDLELEALKNLLSSHHHEEVDSGIQDHGPRYSA